MVCTHSLLSTSPLPWSNEQERIGKDNENDPKTSSKRSKHKLVCVCVCVCRIINTTPLFPWLSFGQHLKPIILEPSIKQSLNHLHSNGFTQSVGRSIKTQTTQMCLPRLSQIKQLKQNQLHSTANSFLIHSYKMHELNSNKI